jgi:hypothetical protein
MKNYNRIICLALALMLAASSPAFAEKGGSGKAHAGTVKGGFEWPWNSHKGSNVTISIGAEDRATIRQLIRKDAFRNCPPGLAKKHPPCIPPGQAKKYYIGSPLPAGLDFYPVPASWGLVAPAGHQYVKVDKDVLLISEASKKVIDAVTLLSAVES